jgi:Domain of unknown function (DUF4193)
LRCRYPGSGNRSSIADVAGTAIWGLKSAPRPGSLHLSKPGVESAPTGWLSPGRKMMEEIEEQIDDELVADEDAEAEEADEAAAAATAAPAPKDAADGEVESIEELIVKKEAQAGEDDDDDTVLSLTREDRLVEPVSEKVVPPQSSEFVCKKCYLVKHRSQLKDKARMLCRDCA